MRTSPVHIPYVRIQKSLNQLMATDVGRCDKKTIHPEDDAVVFISVLTLFTKSGYISSIEIIFARVDTIIPTSPITTTNAGVELLSLFSKFRCI